MEVDIVDKTGKNTCPLLVRSSLFQLVYPTNNALKVIALVPTSFDYPLSTVLMCNSPESVIQGRLQFTINRAYVQP